MPANRASKNKRSLKGKPKDLTITEQLEIFAATIVGCLMKHQDFLNKEISRDKKKSLLDQLVI